MRLFFAILLYLALQHAAGADEILLAIGEHKIIAKISDTPQSREKGLMQVPQLCENCGMLFVFPRPGLYSFWMHNTSLPLSIAFIAVDGNILNIDVMQANSTQRHVPSGNILYALEMHAAWFKQHSIKVPVRVLGLHQVQPGK